MGKIEGGEGSPLNFCITDSSKEKYRAFTCRSSNAFLNVNILEWPLGKISVYSVFVGQEMFKETQY